MQRPTGAARRHPHRAGRPGSDSARRHSHPVTSRCRRVSCSSVLSPHPTSPNVARPAGRNVWSVTPDGVERDSTSSRSCDRPSSGNSRRPAPTTTGWISRLSSSTRSRSSSQRSSSPLPWTWISRPGAALSSRIRASTSPSMHVRVPARIVERGRGHVLGQDVDAVRDGIARRRGAASRTRRSPTCDARAAAHRRARTPTVTKSPVSVVEMRRDPAAALEPAAAILIWPARPLVHAVHGQHHRRGQQHHVPPEWMVVGVAGIDRRSMRWHGHRSAVPAPRYDATPRPGFVRLQRCRASDGSEVRAARCR